MSWAVEEWKDGLPQKVLRKIQEIEGQLDKLKKERQQKQFQVDSLEANLQKQKHKMDSEKSEASALKRENQSLVESCEGLEKTRQKLTHDFQMKEQQVNYLEGQLNSCKKQMERLEQEAKKYKSEVERSQSSLSGEIQPFSTPQKTFATPATPSHWQQDSKLSDLQEKYNREIEERKRLEAENKLMHVKLLNQSATSHKDIARQQAGSSIFPWQQEQKHNHQSLSSLETPTRRRNGASGVSWALDETPIKTHQQFTSGPHGDSANAQQMEQLKDLNQDLRSKVSDLELRLQTQEKDMKIQINKFNEIQNQLEIARKDLVEKDKLLSRSRDELGKTTGQYEQSLSKCSTVEQKLKQVTEEMNCQRSNAESVHRSLEQKIKDQEKERQKEISQLQNSNQALDQQLSQVKNKMNMELQQAKKEHNILQSDMDKVTAVKNRQEKDLEDLKQKLLRSEQTLQASQAKEAELKKKFDDIQREKNTLNCQLDQAMVKVKQLEEEKRNVEQNLAKSRMMVDDFKAKTQTQSDQMTELQKKMDHQSASSARELENARMNLSDIEARNVKDQKELQKLVSEKEVRVNKISALEKETEDLKITTNTYLKEAAEMRREHQDLLQWKSEKEHLIQNVETCRGEMLATIADLEKDKVALIAAQNGFQKNLHDLESEKTHLSNLIDSIKGELLVKCVELEEKAKAYEEVQKHFKETYQKHTKDCEHFEQQMTVLQKQLKEKEAGLHRETAKLEDLQKSHDQLLVEYESVCDLAKSKDSIIQMSTAENSHLHESLGLRERELEKIKEERDALGKEREDTLVQNEEWKQARQELLEKLSLLESDLSRQMDFNADIQRKHEELSKGKQDLLEKVSAMEKREKELINEVESLLQKNKSFSSLENQFNCLVTEAEEAQSSLEQLKELQRHTATELDGQKKMVGHLTNDVETERKKVLELTQENVQLEAKQREIENELKNLLEKYESLQNLHAVEGQEKENLLSQISIMTETSAEHAALKEKFTLLETDLNASNQLCVTLKNSLKDVQVNYDLSVEIKSCLEKDLAEKALLEASLEEVTKRLSQELEVHTLETEAYLEKQKSLEEQIAVLNTDLHSRHLEVKCAEDKLEEASRERSELKQDLDMSKTQLKDLSESLLRAQSEVEHLKEQPRLDIEHLRASLEVLKRQEEEKASEYETLKSKLEDSERERANALDALNEKNENMSKIKVQLEMLQMDLEDNESCMNTFDTQIEELQGTVAILEAKLSESEVQRSNLLGELESVKEDHAKSALEVTQLSACLEQTLKERKSSSLVVAELESIRIASEELQTSLQQETCKRMNLEAMYNSLVEQNLELECLVQELKADGVNCQVEVDKLKQMNECLVSQIAEQKSHTEKLESDRNLDSHSSDENVVDCAAHISEMPFADTSILPFEEDSILVCDSLNRPHPAKECDQDDANESSEHDGHVLKENFRSIENELTLLKLQHAEELQRMEEGMLSITSDLESKLRKEKQQVEMLSIQLEATLKELRDVAKPDYPEVSQKMEKSLFEDEEHLPEEPGSISLINMDTAESNEELVAVKENLRMREEELSHLQSQFEVLTSEMEIRKVLSLELEEKINIVETEKANSTEKCTIITEENQRLDNYIRELTEEAESLKLQLQTSNSQLTDVMEVIEGLEMAKGEWDDTFFQIESELKKARSEKSNLEKHILSMEADIEKIQEQTQKQSADLDASRKTNCSLEQQLNVVKTESERLREELVLCTEEKESERFTLKKLEEKTLLLETREANKLELIKVLEEEIRTGKAQQDELVNQTDIIKTEKEQIEKQTQHLENRIALLNEENQLLLNELNELRKNESSATRESENMSSQMNSLECENVRLSQSLESSLVEKGEIASRLIQTQEEVSQMRQGIEKLKVRIESDERKKNQMSQLLQTTQRTADLLHDDIAKLERERELSDQNLENAVLQAETAKDELEDIQAEKEVLINKIEEMATELFNLKEEKNKLEEELQTKINLIDVLQLSFESTSEKLKSIEQAMEEKIQSQQEVVQDFQAKLEAMEEELLLCRNQLETSEKNAQDLTSQLMSAQREHQGFVERQLENESCISELRSSHQSQMKDFEVRMLEVGAENERLQSQLLTLSSEQSEKDELESEKVKLQSTVAHLEEQIQMQSNESKVVEETVTYLKNYSHQLESQLVTFESMKVTNSELIEKLSEVEESNLTFQMNQQDHDKVKERLNTVEGELNLLVCQLQESEQRIKADELKLEALEQKSDVQESHRVQIEENLKKYEKEINTLQENLAAAEENVSQVLSDYTKLKSEREDSDLILKGLQIKLEGCEKEKLELNSKVERLSKEKERAMSKIGLWMKSCKQLESEKQTLQEELQQQTAALQTTRTEGGDNDSIEELREALEEKSREADDIMDRYCSLMVKVHKLEEANESLRTQLNHLTTQAKTPKIRRSSRCEKSNLENSKPVESPESVQGGKRQRMTEDSANKAQEALHNITKRLKATPQATQADEDFRPEGLPELVQRGFADIPAGEMSPFIIRRTTVPRCSPRLAARANSQDQGSSSSAELPVHFPKMTAEGRMSDAASGGKPRNSAVLTALTCSPQEKKAFTNEKNSRLSFGLKNTSEVQEPKQEDNCYVQ